MQPDGEEVAPLDEANARGIVSEEPSDQLVEPALLSRRSKRLGQRRADAPAARLGRDIDAALADSGVTRTSAVGGEARPADDPSTYLAENSGKRSSSTRSSKSSADRGSVSKVEPRSAIAVL